MAEKIPAQARREPCLNVFVSGSVRRPKNSSINSHYRESIPEGNAHGRSRAWGDAPLQVQQETVKTILSEARTRKWSAPRTAFALALARVESGFNPDAAAASTSASGIGQFVDRTGQAYGLNANNRFDLRANVRAMFDYMSDCMRMMSSRSSYVSETSRFTDVYACYHDGPSLGFDGRAIAAREVIPWSTRFSHWLAGCPAKLGLDS